MKHKIIIAFLFLLMHVTSFAQDKNVALNKPVVANSESGNYPSKNVVDGKVSRNSKWMSGNVNPPHILEIDLQKYCNIYRIIIYTGITEAERKASEFMQAACFWSAKNLKP